MLVIDGTAAARLERSSFRGAWLSFPDDTYLLDLDVGEVHQIQVSGPVA